jgi:hypothetical protein
MFRSTIQVVHTEKVLISVDEFLRDNDQLHHMLTETFYAMGSGMNEQAS